MSNGSCNTCVLFGDNCQNPFIMIQRKQIIHSPGYALFETYSDTPLCEWHFTINDIARVRGLEVDE